MGQKLKTGTDSDIIWIYFDVEQIQEFKQNQFMYS